MKKSIIKAASLALATIGAVSFASCSTNKLLVGKEYVVADSQLAALMKLDKGEADVAVIDSVMAGYYTSTGDYAEKMQIVEGLVFAEEQYGIAAKKGNDALVSKINEALIAIRETGYASLIEEYNLSTSVALTAETTNPLADATDGYEVLSEKYGEFFRLRGAALQKAAEEAKKGNWSVANALFEENFEDAMPRISKCPPEEAEAKILEGFLR